MNFRLCLIYFLSFYFVSVGCNESDVNLILSFVTLDERPTSFLMPHLCWSPYKIKTLVRTLCEVGIGTAFSLQRNRTEYHLQHIVILADLSCPGVERFLLKANEEGYFKSPYRWLLLNYNIAEDTKVLDNLDILIDSDVVVATNINQESVLNEVYKISEHSNVVFTTRAIWKDKSSNDEATFSYALTHNGKINDDKRIEDREINTSNDTRIAEVHPKNNNLNKYGMISDYRKSKVLSSRRSNLRRHVLTMANVITDSNQTRKHMDDRLNLHQDSITKMSYAVVKICFEMLNATEKLIFTHTWGYRDKNGNWQGIVDHLIKKEADLGTLTIFTQERMDRIDYIAMVGSTAVRFVFREPPLAYVSNIFTLPFTGTVWLAILICVLGCSLFLFIASKWESTVGMHPLQLNGSWADVLILIIGAVLQQGCTLEPRYAAGRCVTLILFVALTILYAAYSANIVVLLRAPSSSVRSLPDLLNSPLKLGASDFEYNRYFFKKLNDPIRKSIYDKKIAPKGKKPNYYTMEEGVEKIRRGLFAFHMELNPGYRLIQETYREDEKCDLVEIDYINEIDPWVPGQKRSPHKDLFKIKPNYYFTPIFCKAVVLARSSQPMRKQPERGFSMALPLLFDKMLKWLQVVKIYGGFLKIRESGIQANIHHRLHVPRPRCSGAVSTFSSVGITDMYPAMLATVYGMMLAPAVLILEFTYRRLFIMQQKTILSDDNSLTIPYIN